MYFIFQMIVLLNYFELNKNIYLVENVHFLVFFLGNLGQILLFFF